jgi:hypothetical protein
MNAKLIVVFLVVIAPLSAQDVWFRFDKAFIVQHVSGATGFGSISVSLSHPAKNVHSVSCGGQDGELHIGVLDTEVSDAGGGGVSGIADSGKDDRSWGLVVEPVNLVKGEQGDIATVSQASAKYSGFFRIWNEGHYKGTVYPSNPHHVLELHPMWSYSASNKNFDQPSTVHPMSGFAGYGASKFRALLQSIANDGWLQPYEDADYVYINLHKADNFYQLPVVIKTISDVADGRQATVDVYSDAAHTRRIYENMTVNMLLSPFASKLKDGDKTFLLGIFSVNPRKAMTLAASHGQSDPVDASSALEFFSYGFPHESAVKNSKCVEDTSD